MAESTSHAAPQGPKPTPKDQGPQAARPKPAPEPTTNNQEPTTASSPFEPRLVAFLCHYCAFAAADMAGSMRLQYPPNVRNIRLPCTGKLDAGQLLRAFEEGADGVMVAGCEEGSCHFLKGNLVAKSRVKWVKTLLAQVGIEPERLHMYNLSSAMGPRWAAIVQEMVERVRGLGPSPVRGGVSATTSSKAGRVGDGGGQAAGSIKSEATK